MYKYLIFSFILILIQSCAYKRAKYTTEDGKAHFTRLYFDPKKQREYEDKIVYKSYYKKTIYPGYSGEIKKDTIGNYTYFQFDTIRIYLSNDLKDKSDYSVLFESGLLNPHVILCALDSLCRYEADSIFTNFDEPHFTLEDQKTPMSIAYLMKEYAWKGARITITNIRPLSYLEKSSKVKIFEIDQRVYRGGPGHAFYYIQFSNNKATNNTTFKEFIAGAHLTFIKYTGTYFEI